MSVTATITNQENQGGIMAYVTVDDSNTVKNIAVFVSSPTVNLVPETEFDIYLQARALLSTGYPSDALNLVSSYATGSITATGEDTRNWAALWVVGNILS